MHTFRPRQTCKLPTTSRPAANIMLISAIALLLFTLILAPAMQAQTFHKLYTFTGYQDGGQPFAGVTLDSAGNVYGTSIGFGPQGGGTVFRLTRTNGRWAFLILGFTETGPYGRVVFGPGNALYGTSVYGSGSGCNGFGCGTVYKVPPATVCIPSNCQLVKVLYSFTGGADGSFPWAGDATFDAAGNLYGTAGGGGSTDSGVVFKLTPSGSAWTESVLYNFAGGEDGSAPYSGVIFDSAGNLYGTTLSGGTYGQGTVYRLAPSQSGWVETILHSFQGGSDGAQPIGRLIMDRAGNLYGTTTGWSYGRNNGGGGSVFELSPSGGSWTFTSRYAWGGPGGGGPYGNLAMDAAGNLYGAASGHGAYSEGVVFELTPGDGGWIYTDLHDFNAVSLGDGSFPAGGVTLDTNGNLYGTTMSGGSYGGDFQYCGLNFGCGIVWEITP
jgi:uncharacterized repeat protein (TIGR03803 family)